MTRLDIAVGTILRYPKPAKATAPVLDGMPNFHYATRDPRAGSTMATLERGITAMAEVLAVDGFRRPAVLIRSSPARAGTERTPWEDVIDVDRGELTYFGDHKPENRGALGSTTGNRALEQVAPLHASEEPYERLLAPPLLVFVTVPWLDSRLKVREKGAVRFLGPAVIQELIRIRAVDDRLGVTYPNYRTRLRLTDLESEGGVVDWQWINARKDPNVGLTATTGAEPPGWGRWRACIGSDAR